MEFIQIKAGNDDVGRRIDRVLRKLLPDLALGEIYKHLRKGTIKVNAKKAAQDYRMNEGDVLFLASFLEAEIQNCGAVQLSAQAEAQATKDAEVAPNSADASRTAGDVKQNHGFKLETLFQNEHIRAVNKPFGVAVHKSNSKEISLAEIVAAEYRALHQNESLSFTAGPLHRLDKNTSGIIVFSQSLKGAQWFSENLPSFKKEYLGIVQGEIDEPQYWVDFIDDTPKESGTAYKTVRISSAGKEARTHCFPLSHGSYKGTPVVLCRFCIETGRKHQIRAQSAFHGFPLLGDSAYNADFRKGTAQPNRFYLHAFKLSVPPNPIGMPQTIEAPLPEDFSLFLSEECHFPAYLKISCE